MEKKNIIKNLILDHQEKLPVEDILPRELSLPTDKNKIIVVSGVRRCGKTTLLKLTQNKLLDKGIEAKKILFFNFDDERLLLQTEELDLILQSYRELYPDISLNECYFFFDEIQNIDHWDKFVRRIYDNETKNIFISGSNGKLLGSEIASSLRGRTMQYELYPLSFFEFLSFNNITKQYYGDKNKGAVMHALSHYLHSGGFPEIIDRNDEDRLMILSAYYRVLLFRDIIERYNVTRISALKYFIKRLISNLGKPFSINKIFNDLRSQGIKADKDYLYEIMEYIEAVYLSFRLYKFDYSVVNREMSDKKLYAIDNGLINAISWQFSDDLGKLFENTVYLWLKRLFSEDLFYFDKKNECDFIVFDRDKPAYAIQACYDPSEKKTLEREIKGLTNALEYFRLDTGYLITAENEDEIVIHDKTIKIVPAYKMMIDNKF